MKVCVIANDEQKNELLSKPVTKDIQLIFEARGQQITLGTNYDLYLLLTPDIDYDFYFKLITNRPVIINSVVKTLTELNAPENFYRINGWNTFLKRDSWEIASKTYGKCKELLQKLSWKVIEVKDTPGFIAAKVIAMIINEAYMGYEEEVATKEDIDIAMKSGTNYPYGPFEWAQKIGLSNIVTLLNKLYIVDSSYKPSATLIQESQLCL